MITRIKRLVSGSIKHYKLVLWLAEQNMGIHEAETADIKAQLHECRSKTEDLELELSHRDDIVSHFEKEVARLQPMHSRSYSVMDCKEELEAMERELDKKDKEIERLNQIIVDPKVMDIGLDEGGLRMDLKLPHWATRAMAASFADTLGDAPNWQAMQIGPMPSDNGMIIVTIQKASGKSPTETVGKLRDEIEKLKMDAADADKTLGDYEGFMDRIDAQVSESLEKIGEFPGKPSGLPDRVDVACRLIELIPGLKSEIAEWEAADKHREIRVQQMDRIIEAGRKQELENRKEIAELRLDILAKDEKIRVYEHKPTLDELLNLMM